MFNEQEYYKKYYLEHKKEKNNYTRIYRKTHLEEHNASNRRYYNKHKEEINRKKRMRTIQQKENTKEYNKIWRLKNRSKINKYMLDRKKEDPGFKTLCYFRSRMNKSLNGKLKITTTRELTGCDIELFNKYIEAQFKPGMNWNNRGNGKGKWNIDHIRPCISFNWAEPESQFLCFHFLNQQPLWWEENILKGNKYNEKTWSKIENKINLFKNMSSKNKEKKINQLINKLKNNKL